MNKILLFAAAFLFAACGNNEPEDRTQELDKDGAVETSMDVQHLNATQDILITTHKVWVKNNLTKTVEYRDTLPALGMVSTEAENNAGDTKQVQVQRDYEIFITVK